MEVKVNVYDIASKVTRYTSWLGLGVYHTGVQIGSREYTFSNAGVIYHSPLQAGEEAVFKETIDFGEIDSMTEVNAAVGQLRAQFAPGSYNLVTQNCNHFTDALVRKLVNRGIPGYINRAARLGGSFAPKDVTGDGSGNAKSKTPATAESKGKSGAKASSARPKLSEEQLAKLAKIKGKGGAASASAVPRESFVEDEQDAEDDVK